MKDVLVMEKSRNGQIEAFNIIFYFTCELKSAYKKKKTQDFFGKIKNCTVYRKQKPINIKFGKV